MADVEESSFSLMSLEDELTCSICLSPFDCPVTIPCGHNFCQDCLLATWKDSCTYSCPQCRSLFASRPELKKNTVLSSVVETFTLRSSRGNGGEEKKDVIRCDTCLEAEASRTCLTCMASFCEQHLRPHHENPIFSAHQLSEPVGDLSERICPNHHKLMELFCSQHSRPICSLCLQVHKGCTLMTPDEQRNLKESELRDKLGCLDRKIERTEDVTCQMKEAQSRLKEDASKRKAALAALYQHMRDILAQDEHKAHLEVDCELEVGHNKLRELINRLSDNTETMRNARDDINSLLSQPQATAFLQASYDLPNAVKFDPHVPRVNLDSKKVTAIHAFANALKQHLTEMLDRSVEDRLPIVNPHPGEKVAPVPEPACSTSAGPQPESDQATRPTAHVPAPPPLQPHFQPVPVPVFYRAPQVAWTPPHRGRGASAGFNRPPPVRPPQKTRTQSQTSHQSHKQDKKSTPGGKEPSTTGSHFTKKGTQSQTSHQSHKQDKKSTPGGKEPSTTGSHFTKKGKPTSHHPPKATGHHPQNKKK